MSDPAPRAFRPDGAGQKPRMADPAPAGGDVASGAYRCTNCGYELDVSSTKHLPPCPSCGHGSYEVQTGGAGASDPYPSP